MSSSEYVGRILHVSIPSLDLEKTQRFYGSVFGWEFTPHAEGHVLFSDRGGIGGGLTTNAKPSADGILPFIYVDDIPLTLQSVEEAGGSIELEMTPAGSTGHIAVFADLDGNRMGLYCGS